MQFKEIYARVDQATVQSLQDFRLDHPLHQIDVDGVTWNYLVSGAGEEAILLLHGMAGDCDIWWQQMLALEDSHLLISATYPSVDSLEGIARGLVAILDRNGLSTVTVVGSSLGGYVAQYLLANDTGRIQRAVFANTFPPNDLIADQSRRLARLLPWLPERLIMLGLRRNIEKGAFPASGHSELVRAFLLEQSFQMSKAQFISRYHCVVERFAPTVSEPTTPKLMIIEADNDPLVEPELRKMLRDTYPSARVETLEQAGHFPYLNQPDRYSELLEGFMKSL